MAHEEVLAGDHVLGYLGNHLCFVSRRSKQGCNGTRAFRWDDVMSSLALAETRAVIARIERERVLATVLIKAAREALESGPWRRLHIDSNWNLVARLARAWPLRGADLWHLATAKELHAEVPEVAFLSFDTRLAVAADGEGLHTPK